MKEEGSKDTNLSWQDGKSWSDASFWRELCKDLTLTSEQDSGNTEGKVQAVREPSATLLEQRSRLIQDGYVLVNGMVGDDSERQRLEQVRERLKDGIRQLHSRNIPATFILLFDETWELAQLATKLLKECTHASNQFNFDVLAWHIEPFRGGFSPHRDRQPEDVSSSFHPDEQAKYITLWMALSDATPENSCLYVIPKPFDPGYMDGDDVDVPAAAASLNASDSNTLMQPDPLSRALPTKQSYQNIRALPRQAGQCILFTHRIMHWGSRGNPNSSQENNGPRIAISFVCSDPSFEKPYVDPSYFSAERIPPFRIRLLLVCAQLLIYYQRFELPKSCIRACYEYCKQHSDELDPTYRQKVMVEFVKAMKEAATDEVSPETMDTKQHVQVEIGNGPVEDDEEAMMEEMLEAEAQGYGDFEDDYDELDGEARGQGDINVDDDENDDEEDGNITLFGKRKEEDSSSSGDAKKKAKTHS